LKEGTFPSSKIPLYSKGVEMPLLLSAVEKRKEEHPSPPLTSPTVLPICSHTKLPEQTDSSMNQMTIYVALSSATDSWIVKMLKGIGRIH